MHRALFAIVSCALAALLAIGWWLLAHPADAAPTPSLAAELPPPVAGTAPVVATPDTGTNAPERKLAEAAATATPMTGDAPARRHLEGTIVVADADGTLHATCDGFVELQPMVPVDVARGSFEVQSFTTTVTDGRWQADVAMDATRLDVGTIDLDERAAICADTFSLPSDQPTLPLRATWLPKLQVRVIGNDTGSDLADLRVVQGRYWTFDEFRHPGNRQLQVVLEHGRSPLQLQHRGRADSVRYWIHAPGYAWDQIQLATNSVGERTLRLVPGGDVEVTFVGELPADAVLRVRPWQGGLALPPDMPVPQDQPLTEFVPAQQGPTHLDALPAGTWALSLEKGDWFREPVRFGATVVTVLPGTSAPATITVGNEVQRPATVQVRGTLSLSSKWGTDVSIEFEPTDALQAWTKEHAGLRLDTMQPDGPGRYRWGPIDLLAGRWDVTVHGAEHRAVVDVGPGHPDVVDLVVPDPNEVRVRVVDATTGLPVPDAAPSWYGTVDGWSSGWRHVSMEPIGDDWYRCVVGAGTIVIHAHPDGYVWSHDQYEVRPGPNEFVVQVARACGLEITLQDGEVTIPWPDSTFADIEHTTSKAGAAYWAGNRITAQEPGEHTLTLEPLGGYEPIPPRKVVIEPEQWTKVVIQLQRTR